MPEQQLEMAVSLEDLYHGKTVKVEVQRPDASHGAVRMEETGEKDRVQVSDTTHVLIEDQFRCTPVSKDADTEAEPRGPHRSSPAASPTASPLVHRRTGLLPRNASAEPHPGQQQRGGRHLRTPARGCGGDAAQGPRPEALATPGQLLIPTPAAAACAEGRLLASPASAPRAAGRLCAPSAAATSTAG